MSCRTKISLSSLSEADVQRFVLESPATDEDQKEDFKVEKSQPENEIRKQDNISTNNKIVPKLTTHVS